MHDYFTHSLPPVPRVKAMTLLIQTLQSSMWLSFLIGNKEADKELVAAAAIKWMDSSTKNHLTADQWHGIESLLHENLRADFSETASIPKTPCVTKEVINPSLANQSENDSLARCPKRKALEQELICVQTCIRRNHTFDVHRGKGQGVKNINSKFYTPLIKARAMEYSRINTGKKNEDDDLKHAIAFEILIKLAEKGGRVLDEDNRTVLDNSKAVKKVMSALKDKARIMKKMGKVLFQTRSCSCTNGECLACRAAPSCNNESYGTVEIEDDFDFEAISRVESVRPCTTSLEDFSFSWSSLED